MMLNELFVQSASDASAEPVKASSLSLCAFASAVAATRTFTGRAALFVFADSNFSMPVLHLQLQLASSVGNQTIRSTVRFASTCCTWRQIELKFNVKSPYDNGHFCPHTHVATTTPRLLAFQATNLCTLSNLYAFSSICTYRAYMQVRLPADFEGMDTIAIVGTTTPVLPCCHLKSSHTTSETSLHIILLTKSLLFAYVMYTNCRFDCRRALEGLDAIAPVKTTTPASDFCLPEVIYT